MKRYDKLLFVDMNNTSVSPMAEAISQQQFLLEDILIESRGMVVLFPEPINPKAEAILASRSLSLKDHTSCSLAPEDFDERTLILAIGPSVRDRILQSFEGAVNVYELCEYLSDTGGVPDPYGGELADYGHCYERLKELIDQLADKLEQEDK